MVKRGKTERQWPGTKSPRYMRAELGVHGKQSRGDGLSIGRRFASGQFIVIMGIIHFMNEYFICNLNHITTEITVSFSVGASRNRASRMGCRNNGGSPARECRNRKIPPGPDVCRCAVPADAARGVGDAVRRRRASGVATGAGPCASHDVQSPGSHRRSSCRAPSARGRRRKTPSMGTGSAGRREWPTGPGVCRKCRMRKCQLLCRVSRQWCEHTTSVQKIIASAA